MRKLIYVVSIIFLFGNFSCGKVLTREVTIYNDIDTTILFSCIGDVTHIYDNSPNPSRCFTSQMHKIEPSGTTLCTVELDFYTEDIYVYIYKDLSGKDYDLNMVKDCEEINIKYVNSMNYTLQDLENMKYTIVLDSLTLGLKSPE